ncbi:MAG: S8 family serine peptidase [Miltoncostaeaceae bacterium]
MTTSTTIRRPRTALLTAAAGAFLALGAAAGPAAAELTPALDHRLAGTAADGRVAVIAVMRNQVDGESFEDRPGALVHALRTRARLTQGSVTAEIGADVQSFWLVNAFAFDGTPAEIREVADDPRVAEVDLDRQVRVDDAMVDQAPYPNAPEGNWGLAAINAPAAWSAFGARGQGVRVGNIDTGINAAHPALAGKLAAWRDLIGGQPVPYDDNGHGTHTAGTIAGGDAGGGAIGVAPDAHLVIAKGMDANGSGPGSALLAAAEWMTDPDGNPATADFPTVVNNSWSSSHANDTWFRSMIARWRELGIVPVFSAGNTGPGPQTVGSPASYPEVIAVGALDRQSASATFSARGPVLWSDADGGGPAAGTVITKPDVSAPGVAVVSSVGNGYLAYSGTSMAAPQVAGTVALMRQVNPGLSVDQIADILRVSAVDIGAPGPDQDTGHGRVDAYRAVALASGVTPAPLAARPVAPVEVAREPAGLQVLDAPPARSRDTRAVFRVRFEGSTEMVRHRVDDGPWKGATSDTLIAVRLGDGAHTVELQGLSGDGVVASPVVSHRVHVDATSPRLRMTWRRRGSLVVFRAAVRDENGIRPRSVRWSFGDGDVAVGATVRRRFADTRMRRVVVAASDNWGNATRDSARYRPSPAKAPLTRLRLTRGSQGRHATLVVRGVSRRPVGVRVRVRAVRQIDYRAEDRSAAYRTMSLTSGSVVARRGAGVRPGPFALAVPVPRLRAGTYQVEIRARGARTVRTVKLR